MTTTTRNLLLKALSANPRKLILRLSEPVYLDSGEHLIDSNQPVSYVYFLESGSVSQVKTMDEKAVQVATIGPEGMIGVEATLEAAALKYSYVCELEGKARKLSTWQFMQIIAKYPEVKDHCYSYMLALMSQMMLSFSCYVSHALEKRCATRLLLSHDRCQGDGFVISQKDMAARLSVSRGTVNIALRELAMAGIIKYSRGKILIEDRDRLEQLACPCYLQIMAGSNHEQVLMSP